MIGRKYFIDFFQKYLELIFVAQKLNFERNCLKLLPMTNMISKTLHARTCSTL